MLVVFSNYIFSQTVKQENTPSVSSQNKVRDGGPAASVVTETEITELKVNVEKELVSQAEEEDMEALLGTQVLFFFVLNGIELDIYDE